MNVHSGAVVGVSRQPEPPKRGEYDLCRITDLRLLESLLDDSPEALPARVKYLAEKERLAADLAGANPSAIELLLASSIARNWLMAELLTRDYAHAVKRGSALAVGDALQRGLTRAERRMCGGAKTLAGIRGLDVRLTLLRMPPSQDHE